jgi:pimeloyl-ACP methyl ester carboxylesterase
MDQWYARPQTLVKVGRRRRLNLLILGEGSPTVIFSPGGGASTLEWARVQHPISAKTRTVAYDNAGFGFSDPGPLPRTARAAVDDLRVALKEADIRPPYVLAGWSLGGLHMRLFAFRHPEEVVGMVLVDSSTEHQGRRLFEVTGNPLFDATRRARHPEVRAMKAKAARVEKMAREGALKPGTPEYDEFVGPPLPTVTPAVNAARVKQFTSPGRYRAMRSEMKHFMGASSDEVAAARRPLGDMPIIMLTASRLPPNLPPEQGDAWRQALSAMHDEFAALSTRGVRRTVDAGHGIQIEKPDVVIGAIEEVLAQARAGRGLL